MWENRNKQKNSGFADLGFGVAFDETVIKKWSCHPRPTKPREVPQSIKKTEKTEKITLSTYFPPNPYFLPDIPCFYFEDRRKKKEMTDHYKII